MNLFQVGLDLERVLVPKGDINNAVVREGRERRDGGGLMATAQGRIGDEETGVLASERARSPELASSVPESLEMQCN